MRRGYFVSESLARITLNHSWRMIRTPRPAGGRDVVSIMKSADITESDPDFAGLMLRCSDTSTEVLIVLLRPLLPHEQPSVVIEAGSRAHNSLRT